MASASKYFHELERIVRLGIACTRAKCYLPDNNIRSKTDEESFLLLWFYDGNIFYDLDDMKRYVDGKPAKRIHKVCSISIAMALINFNLMNTAERNSILTPSGTTDNKFAISYIRSLLIPTDIAEINKMIGLLEDGMPNAEQSKRDDMRKALEMLREIISESPKK